MPHAAGLRRRPEDDAVGRRGGLPGSLGGLRYPPTPTLVVVVVVVVAVVVVIVVVVVVVAGA
eukprot:14142740-Heterocapsa_arctica.AAC.1